MSQDSECLYRTSRLIAETCVKESKLDAEQEFLKMAHIMYDVEQRLMFPSQ